MNELCYGYSYKCYLPVYSDSLREIDNFTTKFQNSIEMRNHFYDEISSFDNSHINYINKVKENGGKGNFFILNDNISKNDIRVLYSKDINKLDSKKTLNRDLKILKNDCDRVKLIRKFYKKFDYILMTESFKVDNRGYHTLDDCYRDSVFNKLYSNIRSQIKNKLGKDGEVTDKSYYYVRLFDTFFYNEGFDNNVSISSKILKETSLAGNSLTGTIDENLSLTLIDLNNDLVNEINLYDDFYIEEKDDDRTWMMH